jgi:putative hydrolase of the HAD superfamily
VAIRAVVFDFFGTLTPAITLATRRGHMDVMAAGLGVDGAALHAEFRRTFPDRIRGTLGDLAATVRTVAADLGVQVTDAQVDAAVEARLEGQRSTYTFRDDAVPTLQAVQARGLRIGLVSDCSIELPMVWSELAVAAYVEGTVFSCVEHLVKPDRRLFERIAERLGVDPASCLYVGDGGGHELPGAAAAGMRAVLLDAPDRHLDDAVGRQDDWDGERIATLGDVIGLLEATGDADVVDLAHRMFDLARAGSTAELAAYVDSGVPVDLTDASGNTLLMLAAYHGHPLTVAALLDRGADAGRANDRGQTPLAGAVFKVEAEVAKVLYAAGADPDAGQPSARETARFFDRPDLAALFDD